ncbi:uncharacterized protein LOC133133184 isoform X3 [Conger conger]|uniref:uncharacterized protein LOC133133184 isoform X3 n=1 Tax=Conger conger TaxID=82655 RepID=UPI002A5ACBC5|nr:uncharacterized protein LOC133133184 isoform X3 [Conger conger]
MLSPYTSCHFYLILTLINSWTDAVTITEAVNITAPPSLTPSDPPHVVIERKTTNRSGCLWLLCELNGMESAQVNFTWSRNGDDIRETSSSLHLCKPDWSEGDIFTCSISQSSNPTGLSVNITITQSNSTVYGSNSKLIIICVSALAGTVILICLVVCMYKCKKADSRGGSIVYTNKVYENFSFSKARPPTERTATTQREQCIYEN